MDSNKTSQHWKASGKVGQYILEEEDDKGFNHLLSLMGQGLHFLLRTETSKMWTSISKDTLLNQYNLLSSNVSKKQDPRTCSMCPTNTFPGQTACSASLVSLAALKHTHKKVRAEVHLHLQSPHVYSSGYDRNLTLRENHQHLFSCLVFPQCSKWVQNNKTYKLLLLNS